MEHSVNYKWTEFVGTMAGVMSGNETDYLRVKQILDIYCGKFNFLNNGKQFKGLM